ELTFGRLRPVERAFALATIELTHVAARQRHIGDAIAVDVEAARPEPRERRLIDFRQPGLGVEPDHIAGITKDGAPDSAVDRVYADAVEAGVDAFVLGRIDRLVRLHIVIDLAVAVGVDDDREPALGLRLVTGLFVDPAVQIADHALLWAAGAGPQG